MFSLPNSELYIWLHWSDEGKKVAQEIIDLLETEPSDCSIYQGMCDLRWETKDFETAVKLAESLRDYIDSSEVVLIRATGKVAGEREILTLKDNRNRQ